MMAAFVREGRQLPRTGALGAFTLRVVFAWRLTTAVIFLFAASVEGSTEWSSWLNVKHEGGVDNQSLALIRELFDYSCPTEDILLVECRKAESVASAEDAGSESGSIPNDVFSDMAVYDGDILLIPCNTSGLVCVDADQYASVLNPSTTEKTATASTNPGAGDLDTNAEQSSATNGSTPAPASDTGGGIQDGDGEVVQQQTCSDYEIRFLCEIEDLVEDDNTPPPPAFENPLKVNGGFIAMAAGLSVVIPLMCVLIIQLRRAKREEAERRLAEERMRGGAGSGSENGDGSGSVYDLPPSYEQLFGGTDQENESDGNTPSAAPAADAVIHSRNSSLDMLIDQESDTSGTARRSNNTGPSPSGSPSSSSVLPGSGGSPVTVAASPVSDTTSSNPGNSGGSNSEEVSGGEGGSSGGGGGGEGGGGGGGGSASRLIVNALNNLARRNRGGGPQHNPTFIGSTVSVISELDEDAAAANVESREGGAVGSAPTDSSLSESEGYVSSTEDGAPAPPAVTSPPASVSVEHETGGNDRDSSHMGSRDSGMASVTSSSSSSSSLANQNTSTRTPSTSRTPSSPTQSPAFPPDLPPPEYTPPAPPPLPLTPPPPFHANAGETSGNFRLHAIQRRYPNMHLSIHDFIATLRGQQLQEQERRRRQQQQQRATYGDSPPPTYEEALRILQKAKEQQRNAPH